MEIDEIQNNYKYHAPKNEETKILHENVRDLCKDLALDLKHICPPGRELSLAFTNLEQVMMWANAAIARKN